MYDLLCTISFYLYKNSILIVTQKRARDLSQESRASLYVYILCYFQIICSYLIYSKKNQIFSWNSKNLRDLKKTFNCMYTNTHIYYTRELFSHPIIKILVYSFAIKNILLFNVDLLSTTIFYI